MRPSQTSNLQSAEDVISTLGLMAHPEGGWYAETFRDDAGSARGHSTAIYYLLTAGQRSHRHRLRDAVEVWHFYAGYALLLTMSADGEGTRDYVLGPNLAAGERPQLVVPRGWWQMAEPLGAWSLVGCTVAPGFLFDQFELAPQDWTPKANA